MPGPPCTTRHVSSGAANDRVLLGLNGRDDVAHRARARASQLGEQRIGDTARADEHVGVVEVLLEHVGEPAGGEHEAAAALQPEWVGESRAVEGCRDRRPPVDDDRHAVGVLDVAPPDVPAVTELLVDAAETQHRGVVLERRQPPLQLPLHGIGVGLVGAEDVLGGDLVSRSLPHPVETHLREPQARAFRRQIRMGHSRKGTTRRISPSRELRAPVRAASRVTRR